MPERRARRYICIHGHFYQPPRENPWLETVADEPSAYPFPNWNQRILAECYRPNAAARIVDRDNRIIRIANNYQHISFNFGPTLLSWLERQAPDVYRAIQDADRQSCQRFSGHGSAMAQAYNHIIMPLANRRDKVTQVRWGIADFKRRFGRAPEGMWLPETAVDDETLDVLAEHGIAFTVLAPKQARRIRRLPGPDGSQSDWCEVSDGSIEPGRAYRAITRSGRHIDIFFYHGQNSNAIAFERLLENGGRFAERLATSLLASEPSIGEARLSHVATDGETYGHHHRYGDMALAYALHSIDGVDSLQLTNYGQFRELHPARYQVEVIDETAWSCAHGVGRWSDDCGCHMGGGPRWNQAWRRPLREALDRLRDRLAELFVARGNELLRDPWLARDRYIEVILDRSPANIDRFLEENARRPLDDGEQCAALQLLEMQRHALLMYTSCGWFFDDFTGPEGTQILRYAARAIELGERVSGQDLESEFLTQLAKARSNRPEMGDGRSVYDKLVRPAKVDLQRVIAHYAVSSLFEDRPGECEIHCYHMQPEDLHVHRAGKAQLIVGTVRCTSTITRATSTSSFAALHFGDHNLTGGARRFTGEAWYQGMVDEVTEAFSRADLVATQRILDRHFIDLTFSLESLFPDERKAIVERILQAPLADVESAYQRLYSSHAPLMRYLEHLDLPMPEALASVAQFISRARLRRSLSADVPDLVELRAHLVQAELIGVVLADEGIDYLWRQALERLADRLSSDPDDLAALQALRGLAELVGARGIDIDLWRTQNACYQLLRDIRPGKRASADAGAADGGSWLCDFDELCRAVRIAVPGAGEAG